MIIMGVIGMFVGIIASVGILVSSISKDGPRASSHSSYMYLTVIVLTLVFGFIGSKMKPEVKIDKSLLNQERLSKKEKTYIWIFSLINPVITNLITYHMYKDVYPKKVKMANIISCITFIPWIIFVLYMKGFIKW